MKINLALVISIIVAVGLVAFGFTAVQIASEREKLNNELEVNTIKLAEDFYKNHLTALSSGDSAQVSLTDSIAGQYNFIALAIYFNADSVQFSNEKAAAYFSLSEDYISQAISADTSISSGIKSNGQSIHQYIRLVKRADLPALACTRPRPLRRKKPD